MENIVHKMIDVNGINMHIAEFGHGPTVLLLHGFPELWYSWRHQIVYLGSHGYHAVAPDLRGFGDTTGAPTNDATKFTVFHVVGDLVALIDTVAGPNEEKVLVVGHDWGAVVAWGLCLYRPDKVKALVNLSGMFSPRNPKVNPVDGLRAIYGNDHYISRFQEPGEMEAEFTKLGTEKVLKQFLTYRKLTPPILPKDLAKRAADNPITLPSWLSEEDITYYASKYEKAGFTGGLNYYRAINLSWELTAPWTGAQVKVPAKFIIGDMDLTYNTIGIQDYIHKGGFKKDVPYLEDVVVMQGVGHFLHEEKPDEINNHIHDFFKHFI